MTTFQEIIKGEIPVLVDFHAEWCAPCKTMNPILKNIKKHFGDELKIIKINTSHDLCLLSMKTHHPLRNFSL